MAEARSAIRVGGHATGVQLGIAEGHFDVHLRLKIPYRPSAIAVRVRRQLERLRNLVVNGSYPLGPLVLGILMLAIPSFVLLVSRDHWIRQGWLGTLVWNIGHMFPFVDALPLAARVGWLTMWATVIGFFLLTTLQRVLLRLLFSYQAFLYAGRGKVPLSVKLWGLAVKLLSGRKPMTYGFDSTMPHRPVPNLKATCRRWLESVKPLRTEEEYKQSEALVESFLANEGPRLQRYLHLKKLVSRNYVNDWWEKYCYHKGRSSIMINSNYYVVDGLFKCPTTVRNARAAQMTHNILKYNRLVERELIPPMLVRGMVPLCMTQHVRMFATTRIPGRDCDSIKHYEYQDVNHIAVLYRGHWFKVDVIRKDGRILAARELEELFDFIVEEVERLGPNAGEEGAVAALTSDNRTKWAEARETYFNDGLNRASLHAIESAVFCVILEDETPETFTECGRLLIAGTGANRWFDKSICLVAFANGRMGLNCEHSWADAPVIAHMYEWVMMTGDLVDGVYQDDGHTRDGRSGSTKPLIPARILFDVPSGLRERIKAAQEQATASVNDFDLCVRLYDGYGKGFMKRLGVSPDAFIQMALQITYFRNIGKFHLTYESAMARLFRDGRTETIRSVSRESVAFVRAFLDDTTPVKEQLQLLRASSKRHVRYTADAMTGKGVDRHLFALYIVSKGKEVDSPFLNSALSEPWRLSTSQQPQQQTNRWNLKNPEHAKRMGAGGGFGPVCDDGYGVSYMVAGEDHIIFHVSSKQSCAATSSTAFMDTLYATLGEMQKVFLPVAKPLASKPAQAKKSD